MEKSPLKIIGTPSLASSRTAALNRLENYVPSDADDREDRISD